jgi:DNA processing protein
VEQGERERFLLVGLWSVPGVGPKALRIIRERYPELSAIEQADPRSWSASLDLPRAARAALQRAPPLKSLANAVSEAADRAKMGICFPGDPAWPTALSYVNDAPPLLFYLGSPTPPVPRLAMVGCRHPEGGFAVRAHRFAWEVAQAGIGVVSGAALGIDRACHFGALTAGQQTWAFLGSALDQLDDAQARLLPEFLSGQGVFYSELPPGVRANPSTFPRRNRLISGAADGVLVLRAGGRSGSLHTVLAALKQGRPIWALPGEMENALALGCNTLIRNGHAKLCLEPQDIIRALKAPSPPDPQPVSRTTLGMSALSEEARLAYQALMGTGNSFEELLRSARLAPAVLTSALCELELFGFVVQHPGRWFVKVGREI